MSNQTISSDPSGIPQALPNMEGGLFTLDGDLIERAIALSRTSRRRRIILPIHRRQEALVQRMLNILQPDTYIRPHHHPEPHASESIVVLRGGILFLLFDPSGGVTHRIPLREGTLQTVVDIEPGQWHSFLVTQPDTILFEAKKGPYSKTSDKHFAAWSPEEGQPGALAWLRNAAEGAS